MVKKKLGALFRGRKRLHSTFMRTFNRMPCQWGAACWPFLALEWPLWTCLCHLKRFVMVCSLPVVIGFTICVTFFGFPSFPRPKNLLDHRIEMLRRLHTLYPADDYPPDFLKEEMGMFTKLCPSELSCELANVYPHLLSAQSERWRDSVVKDFLPVGPIFDGRRFANCVAVSNSAALSGSGLGKFIDSHELILRFNHAPTKGFEQDVGSRTDVRIINDLVLRDRKYYLVPSFNFMTDPLYRNLTLIGWVSKDEELREGEILEHYIQRRRLLPDEDFHLFEVQGLWDIWAFFQKFTPTPIVQYTPSSGTLGLLLLLHHCDVVHGIEFIPSIRFHYTYGCHYFEIYQPLPCTFYSPHPKTSEMTLWYRLNQASDKVVFGHGVVQLRGFTQSTSNSDSNCDYCDLQNAKMEHNQKVDYSLLPPLTYE